MKNYSILKEKLEKAGCKLVRESYEGRAIRGVADFKERASFNYKDMDNPYGIVKILEDKSGNLQLGLMQLTLKKRNDFHHIQEAINIEELSNSNTI